ncbi:uncharacterized protein [Periplaneta americana]|uniref:uncharacterized protein n=1 Tax=Periplaneta americana TaxID=6978 RepID=UPI0037E7DE03
MDDVADRSAVPPPLPPKTRKNINTGVIANNQVITTSGTPPVTKTTVFAAAGTDDASVTPPTEPEHHEMFSFSFPEVRSLNLVTGQTRSQPHSITNGDHHVVKIRINPGDDAISTTQYPAVQQYPSLCSKPQVSSFGKQETQSLTLQQTHYTSSPAEGCIRISVSSNDIDQHHQHEEMVRRSPAPGASTSNPGSFIKSQPERSNPYFFYGSFPSNGMVISSGQSSPSDTLDSGTCSDLDGSTPPPLPKKKSPAATVTVTVNGGRHRRTGSLTSSGAEVDSDDDGSNISCDSLNSSDLNGVTSIIEEIHQGRKEINEFVKEKHSGVIEEIKGMDVQKIVKPPTPPTPPTYQKVNSNIHPTGHSLPQGLLQDIRDRTAKLTIVPSPCSTLTRKTRTWADDISTKSSSNSQKSGQQGNEFKNGNESFTISLFKHHDISPTSTLSSSSSDDQSKRSIVEEKTYEERQKESAEKQASGSKLVNNGQSFDTDRFYTFHLNEHVTDSKDTVEEKRIENEETFAGYRDLLQGKESSSTIRSAKGTVRGVKNRVRAGIATFLQLHSTKNYKKEEAGKVVVYTTTMGVVRDTYQDCVLVKKILRNLMVKYEERDVFMSRDTQTEIRERMGSDVIIVPQVFVEGQHVGDAETIEKLNESGELRRILKPFKSPDACSTCKVCGGHRLLPCTVCNGSKKSVHRNDFTAEFVALKCMHCDEVGLVRCHAC